MDKTFRNQVPFLLAVASTATTIAVILGFERAGARVLVTFAVVAAFFLVLPGVLRQARAAFRALRSQLSWWHGLMLLTFLSGLLFRVRDAEQIQDNALDAWAAYRIGLCGITGFALLTRAALGKTKVLSSLAAGPIGLMALYCMVSATSAIWSVFPAWSFYKSIEFMVDMALVAAIVATVNSLQRLKTLFDWTWILQSALLASVWLGAAVSPADALVQAQGLLPVQIIGIYPALSANSVGTIAAVIGVVAFARVSRARALYGTLFVAALGTVVLAQTRSAIIGLVVGIVVILFFSKRISSMALCAWLGVIVFSQTPAADIFWKYFQRGENQQTFHSLSGRIDWWSAGLSRYLERPLTGYGAYTTRFSVLEELGQGETSTIHNAFLEVLFGAGPFALVPLCAAIIWIAFLLMRSAVRAAKEDRCLPIEALAVFSVILTRSFFSSGLVWHPELNFMCILAYAEYMRRNRSREEVTTTGQEFTPPRVRFLSYVDLNPS